MKCRRIQLLCVVGTVFALASCGGTSHGDGGTGSFKCGSDAGEATPSQVAADGGVGIDQYVRAMATVRCNYWSRCFGLAPYVANECVDALVAFGAWPYLPCGGGGSTCSGVYVSYPSTALLQAVAAGTLQYDPQRSGQCVAALQAEGCASYRLVESIPACSGVFTCATDAGSHGAADGGAADGGAADGGADFATSCAGFLFSNYSYPAVSDFFGTTPTTCSTDTDCAGLAALPGTGGQSSYCVAGFCSASQCEIGAGGCTTYAQAGQPCVGNALSIVHWDDAPQTETENCGPGLACSGAVDGGAGTCVTPQDVGGPCTRLADCASGLVCGCGICQIPPSAGPCADGLCKVGVAYCDPGSNLCQPVHVLADSCDPNGPVTYCGPGLSCSCPFGGSGCSCQPPG